MTLQTLHDAQESLITHTTRFSRLCERMGAWGRGWLFSVNALIKYVPAAPEALADDMREYARLVEELQEVVTDLARDYLALGTAAETATRDAMAVAPSAQSSLVHPSGQ